MHDSVFSLSVTEEIVTKVAIGTVPAGTKLKKTNNGYYVLDNSMVFTEDEVNNEALFKREVTVSETPACGTECRVPAQANVAEEVAPIDEDPSFNPGAVINSESFGKIQDAVAEQKAIGDGEKYYFYSVNEKRWAKATMERTSSDLGRLMSGFALPVTTTAKSKKNRLKKLNEAYGLGLSNEEIDDIANS